MIDSDTAITAGVAAGIVIGFNAAKSGLGRLNGWRKNGNSARFDPKMCSKHGERLAVLETEVKGNLININRELKEIKAKLS
jgi:hypothetical protein